MSSILGLDHVQVAAPAACEDEARSFFDPWGNRIELVARDT